MVKKKSESSARYEVPALARGLKLLEALAAKPEGATAAELSAAMKLPNPSVFRMLLTLAGNGYVVREEETSKYRLSRKLLSVGYSAIDGRGLLERAMDSLHALRDESRESTLLATLSGNEGVVLEQLPGLHPVMVLVQVGHRFPLHTAAPGKAIIAFLPEREREKILNSLDYRKYTSATITTKAALEEELSKIRSSGVAYDRGEELPDIRCVAAPVLDHGGYPVAAVSVSGPASSLGAGEISKLAELVAKHAKAISNRFSISVASHRDGTRPASAGPRA